MNFAIIVAGGTGTRMGSNIPKQFLLLHGLPVMMHAIRAFQQSDSAPQIITVLHPSLRREWLALCEKFDFKSTHALVDGGNSRFESVRNGLAAITEMGAEMEHCLIAVHDAARPLITPRLIDCTFEQAALTGTAALATTSTDSVRLTTPAPPHKNHAYPRRYVNLMQTPQTFNGAILSEAYGQDYDESFTDDASVVEKKGYPITLVNGDTRNIKITFPEDLNVAETFLAQRT